MDDSPLRLPPRQVTEYGWRNCAPREGVGGGGGREVEEARAVIPYWRRQMIRAGQLTHEMRLVFSSGIGNFQAITISESRVMYGPVMQQANSDHQH